MSIEDNPEVEQEEVVIDEVVAEAETEEEVVQEVEETEQPAESEEEEELVVTIGDETLEEEEDTKDPGLVNKLRKLQREEKKRNKQLERELKALKQAAEKPPVELGKKPTLEDVDYDTDRFETELLAWKEQEREANNRALAAQKAQQDQAKAWEEQKAAYQEAKAELKVKDYDDAEETVLGLFDPTQQGLIVQGADNAALLTYAIGKNAKRAEELSKIKDPVKFAFAVAKMEAQLKTSRRKAPPAPEKRVSGSAPNSAAVDSTLKKLRAEAERTGDYSKINRYKRSKAS